MMTIAYDRDSAVAYARRWAYGRNPAYFNFHGIGGDCTNFVSQCLFAGSGVMNYTPVYGWYYRSADDRTASWTGVAYLYDFLLSNQGPGPFAREIPLARVLPGDVIQLELPQHRDYGHTVLAVSVGARPAPDNILIAAHSNDALDRALSSYRLRSVRFLRIEGVRIPA